MYPLLHLTLLLLLLPLCQCLTINKCCPPSHSLSTLGDCVLVETDNFQDRLMEMFHTEVVGSLQLETGRRCQEGRWYMVEVLGVMVDRKGEVQLGVFNLKEKLIKNFACIEMMEGREEWEEGEMGAMVCEEEEPTHRGEVSLCGDTHTIMEDEAYLRSHLQVVSVFNEMPTQAWQVRGRNLSSLCEEGVVPNYTLITQEDIVTNEGFILGEDFQFDCLEVVRRDQEEEEEEVNVYGWWCPGNTHCGDGCLKKCCRRHEILIEGKCEPIEFNMTWSVATEREVVVSHLNSQCHPAHHKFLSRESHDFDISEEGLLVTTNWTTGRYCVDHYWDGFTVHEIALFCEDVPPPSKPSHDVDTGTVILYTVCGAVSLFCLLITFIVYTIIPTFKNLHGNIVRMNIVSIALLTIFLMTVFHISSILHPIVCTAIGFFGYFAGISMFSWMTVMCFDLCWTFTRAELPSTHADKSKFLIYNITAWGGPTLLTVCLLLAQYCLESGSSLQPGIGVSHCFLSEGSPRIYLFHLPILCLMVANSIQFLIIVATIMKTKHQTRKASSTKKTSTKKNGSRVNEYTRDQLVLYIKLLFILGILWSFEGIRALTEHFTGQTIDNGSFLSYLFKFIDILNLLRGLFIMIIFICKKPVILNIRKLCGWDPKGEELEVEWSRRRAKVSQVSSMNMSVSTTV